MLDDLLTSYDGSASGSFEYNRPPSGRDDDDHDEVGANKRAGGSADNNKEVGNAKASGGSDEPNDVSLSSSVNPEDVS
jgi:hypothetical protein